MTARSEPLPIGATQVVDEYFIENRTRLLEIAAFLDRVSRADPGVLGEDFRMKAFVAGVAALAGSTPDRLLRIQMLLSDPTSEPLDRLDRKSAKGAYDPADDAPVRARS